MPEPKRPLYEHDEVAILRFDPDGNIIYANRQACETFGYGEKEFLTLRIYDIDPGIPEGSWPVYIEEVPLGAALKFTRQLRKKDGTGFPALVISHRPETGNGRGLVGFIHDISANVRTEEALRESELFLRKSQEVARLGYYTLDMVTGCWTCSAVMDDIFGIGEGYPKDVDGWIDLVAPDQKEEMRSYLERHVVGGRNRFDREYRIVRRADGKERWVSGLGKLEFNERGIPVRMIGTIQDITERKRTEEALREKERLLRRSQEVARLYSFAVDLASNKWSNSDMSKEILGIDDGYPMDFDGWKELVHPDDWEGLLSSWDRFASKGSSRYEREFRIRRKADGRERWPRSLGELEFDERGTPVRVVGMTMDITERKLEEKEKAALEERLRESHKLETVGRLAGGVAHEFNNMLSIILGYADLMRGRLPEGDPMRKYVDEIERAGGRVKDLTGQLLTFSRKQVIAPKVVNLNGQLAAMIKTLGRLLGDEIRIDFFPGEGLWSVLFDPMQLDQVLMNLGINARDAMPGGGRLTVGTANVCMDEGSYEESISMPSGDYVCMTVADEGLGMDRETLSHIFEPFFSTKGVGKGTGMGLPSVYGIIKQNRGFIEAESGPGKGTTFRIYFPRLGMGGVAAEPPAWVEKMSAVAVPVSVLLVEDSEMVRRIVSLQLESLGCKVSCAESPSHHALDLFGKPDFAVDLLVTDVMMPGMNGAELWKKVRSVQPKTRVLFVSCYTPGEIADRGILGEGERVLSKPFTQTGFAQAVKEALAGR